MPVPSAALSEGAFSSAVRRRHPELTKVRKSITAFGHDTVDSKGRFQRGIVIFVESGSQEQTLHLVPCAGVFPRYEADRSV